MERVLVVGASGHIGVSAVLAALHSKREVLAVVRSQASAEKLFHHAGTKDGITIVQADVTSSSALQRVVDSVDKGDLPTFHHVYQAVGAWNATLPFHSIEDEAFHQAMSTGVFSHFATYKATIPYLLSRGFPHSTWTMITGGAGESGAAGVTALTQGALYSMATVASRELANTNVRFNEVFLNLRVDFDSPHSVRPKDFAQNYELLLQEKAIKGSRISVLSRTDIAHLKWETKGKGASPQSAGAGHSVT